MPLCGLQLHGIPVPGFCRRVALPETDDRPNCNDRSDQYARLIVARTMNVSILKSRAAIDAE